MMEEMKKFLGTSYEILQSMTLAQLLVCHFFSLPKMKKKLEISLDLLGRKKKKNGPVPHSKKQEPEMVRSRKTSQPTLMILSLKQPLLMVSSFIFHEKLFDLS